MSVIDIVAFAIVAIAMLRGISLGLVRETFSIAALVAAVIAVRVWNEPLARWLQNPDGLSVRYDYARWLAGALLAVGALAAIGAFGRVMRQGARAVGLGFYDRLGGAALGAAEGALAAGLLLFAIGAVLGRSHSLIETSRSFALVESAERFAAARSEPPRDVAAPPRSR